MDRVCSTNEECVLDVGGKAIRKETARKTRRKWMDIKMGLRWGGMDGIGLAQDRGLWKALVNTVMKLQFP
jgi:hypothetical protein